jgi:hypothetical protein
MTNRIAQAPYFIELLTRDQNLITRQRFEQLPITIGRGYNNDLILDDPYIAANHALIEMSATGEIVIRDLDSENGLVQQGKRQSQIKLDHHSIRLGHSILRFRHAGYQVEKALKDKASHRWEGWPPAIAGLLMITLSGLISVWLSSTAKLTAISAITSISYMLIAVLVWAGIWAFATRMMSGSGSRFGRHIFIVACAAVLLDSWELISTTLAYAFSLEFLTLYASHIGIAIAAGMIFFHLSTINDEHPKRFIISALVIALVSSSFVLISNYKNNGQLADNLYMTTLLPPALRLSGNMPVASFIENAKELKPKLDKIRQEPADLDNDALDNDSLDN